MAVRRRNWRHVASARVSPGRARVDTHMQRIRPEDRKRRALIGCPEAVGADCVTSDPTPVGRAHVSNPKEVITLPPALDNRRYRMPRPDGRLMRSDRTRVYSRARALNNAHENRLN